MRFDMKQKSPRRALEMAIGDRRTGIVEADGRLKQLSSHALPMIGGSTSHPLLPAKPAGEAMKGLRYVLPAKKVLRSRAGRRTVAAAFGIHWGAISRVMR